LLDTEKPENSTATIRPAQAADSAAVFALAQEFATSFRPEMEVFRASFGRLIENRDALFLVAVKSNCVCGYLLGFDHDTLFANGRVSWIEELMVIEERRREGIGAHLVERFEEWARSRGSRLVALGTRRAASFYRAIAYEESASYFRKLLCIVALAMALLCQTASADSSNLTFACDGGNDLYASIVKGGMQPDRFATAREAIEHARPETGVLLLADGYPGKRTVIDDDVLHLAHEKHLRLYIEYPQALPDLNFGTPRGVTWERAVVASDKFAPDHLPKLSILASHGCQFLPIETAEPDLVLARVAGYDRAVFGLPKTTMPLLFRTAQGDWVATTKLSNFITGRYAPAPQWLALWARVLADLASPGKAPRIVADPIVRATVSPDAAMPNDAGAQAVARYAQWIERSGLLIPASRQEQLLKLLGSGVETTMPASAGDPIGDGSFGLMEGFASQIQPDGTQLRRTPLRADCHAETAMALALGATLTHDDRSRAIAQNLLDFLYFKSSMRGGVRGNPKHPAFGLIAWGAGSPAWEVANYGDDNARTLLATMAAAACLKSDAYDAPMLEALLANLRTTGKLGFRGDRIDIPDLQKKGWRAYHDGSPVNYAPHFESYLWACNLWAYRHTGDREFLERAQTAISMTMRAYPAGWRSGSNIERARMLLPLAWLIRIDDTAEHRQWLSTIAADLLTDQQPCGAIRERLRNGSVGFFSAPASNEAYGTGETPLMQTDGDPVSDQLYTSGFALLGLREAAAATGDAKLRAAEDRSADYLIRIQTRSQRLPQFDGTWFRAFDYSRWECWASSADIGWGAWSIEAGWGQAWTAATLALREKQTNLWELTAESKIAQQSPRVRRLMKENGGEPVAAH
jgi:GNAT superfamily N-acetyltransferase